MTTSLTLPIGWDRVRLGELGVEIKGSIKPDHNVEYELYSVPAFEAGRPENARGNEIGSHKRPVQPGDVLLCKINPRINRVWTVGRPADGRPQIASTEYLVLRLPERVRRTLGPWLTWYLRSPEFRSWIKLNVEGATGSHTRAKSPVILQQMIPVAPADEQRRIVDAIETHLSHLDAGVESLHRARRNSEALRSGLFDRLFDDPIIEWTTMKEVAVIEAKLVDPKQHVDLPHIAPNHIESRTGRLLPYRSVGEDGVTSGKYKFSSGDVIYSKIRPYLAKAAMVDFEGLCSADAYPLTPKVHPRFLQVWLISPRFTELASQHQGRSVLPKINREALFRLQAPIAPMKHQLRLIEDLDRSLSVVEAMQSQLDATNRRSNQLRRAVLAAAFAGRLADEHRVELSA